MTDRTPSSLVLELFDDLHHVIGLAKAVSVLSYFDMDWEIAHNELEKQLESIKDDADRLHQVLSEATT